MIKKINNKLNLTKNDYVLIIIIGLIISSMYSLFYRRDLENNAYLSFEEYYEEGTKGAYFRRQEYYCVWTGNKTFEEIEEIEGHEVCHVLIDVDKGYKHFCEEGGRIK